MKTLLIALLMTVIAPTIAKANLETENPALMPCPTIHVPAEYYVSALLKSEAYSQVISSGNVLQSLEIFPEDFKLSCFNRRIRATLSGRLHSIQQGFLVIYNIRERQYEVQLEVQNN